jgi:sporulation protein YlmC with PRC-barrel domain
MCCEVLIYMDLFQWNSWYGNGLLQIVKKVHSVKNIAMTKETENKLSEIENHTNPNANRPLKVLTATSVIGDKVENKTGEKIGKIKDIMLDITTGKIEYVVVEVGGFLEFNEKLFAIPFSALQLNSKKQLFILDIEKEFLKKAPGFEKDHWPETNEHYTDVVAYWDGFLKPTAGPGSIYLL